MTRLRYLGILVALGVLFAGCTGGGPVDSFDDATATRTTTNEVDDFDLPAGVNASGVNASVVAAGHEAALSNANFTLRSTTRIEEPTATERGSVVVKAGVGTNPVWLRHTVRPENETTTAYAAEGMRYEQFETGEGPVYDATERPSSPQSVFPESYANTWSVRNTLDLASFTPVGVERRDGVSVVVLTASLSDATESIETNVTSFDATVTVDEHGVVRSMSVDATFVEDGADIAYAESFAVTNVTTTDVPQPEWLDEARSDASERTSTPTENVTRTLTDEELGAVVTVSGAPNAVERARLARWSHAWRDADTVQNASVSSFVEIIGDEHVERANVAIAYDESRVPNGNESDLAVYRYNKTVQTFFRLNSTVDATTDTVTATTTDVMDTGEYSTSATYVVFHVQTWRDIWEGNPPRRE